MKKNRLLAVLLSGVLVLALAGCGSTKGDDKTITIGVSPVPHKEIVEEVKNEVEKEGYTLEVKEFDDYETPNTAVEDGEIDANYFQHIAYLNTTNEQKGYHLVNVAEIHFEPMALYSIKLGSLDEIKEGSTIAIPNDPSNEARALRLLEKAGLIKVKDGDLITIADITENYKNLKFKELEAAQLPRVLDEVEGAVINGNYALQADLDTNKNGIFVEDNNDSLLKDYTNILVVKEGNEDSEKIKVLKKALTSDTVKEYINETYKGAVIPVF